MGDFRAELLERHERECELAQQAHELAPHSYGAGFTAGYRDALGYVLRLQEIEERTDDRVDAADA